MTRRGEPPAPRPGARPNHSRPGAPCRHGLSRANPARPDHDPGARTMSLPDLAAVLWRQRELLERLSYRLECEQLLLAAGRARWLSQATSEVEALLAELQVVELQRASAAQ